jgi:hypothetical protein
MRIIVIWACGYAYYYHMNLCKCDLMSSGLVDVRFIVIGLVDMRFNVIWVSGYEVCCHLGL